MALTQISTAGVKDDAVTSGKIPTNAVGASEIADDAVTQAHIATDAVVTANIVDQAVTLAKLPHGTGSNDGKFLRANNGADPTFETVDTTPSFGSQNISTTGTLTSGDITISDNNPTLTFTEGDADPDYRIIANAGKLTFQDVTNSFASRLVINTDGHIDIDGNLDVGAGIDVTGNITGTGGMTIDTNTLHVDSSNNRVGIGTTSPSQLMEIASTAPNIRLTDTIDGHSELDGNAASLRFIADKGNAKANTTISFLVDNSEKVRIDDQGRMGIGTTSPSSLLHLSATTPVFQLTGTSAGNCILQTDGADLTLNVDSGNSNSSSALAFRVDNSEKMRIDSSGVVGIGVTPKTGQYSGYNHLQVGESATLSSNDTQGDTNVTNLTNNVYLNSNASAWKYLHTDEASRYQQYNGGHYFAVAASGSADATASFSNKVRIDTDGLKFNSDTAADNALNDYEEGTFTPTSNNGLGAAEGSYTKIGRQVTLHIRVTVDANTNSNAMVIGGFPFTPSMPSGLSNGSTPSGFGYISGSVINGGVQIHTRYNTAETNFYAYGTNLQRSHFSGRELRFGLVYHT